MATLFPTGIAHYLAGGILLGLAVSLLFATTGLIGGMSTVFTSTWSWVSKVPFFQDARFTQSRVWRVVYAAGLVLGALVFIVFFNGGATFQTSISWWQLLLGGFVAGFGARMSNGCTSGHGICGLGSLQLPSLAAVCIFLGTAVVVANAVKALGGM